ncbi:MAG: hypothetical protein GY943_27625 [Chloroflexi bacterium]|nr:hypothetical protein [Chloroflexota bacterium]
MIYLDITEETVSKQIRKYKERPARVEKNTIFYLEIERKQENRKQAQRLVGAFESTYDDTNADFTTTGHDRGCLHVFGV